MGVIISNYKLYNGAIKVDNVYLKLRDIRSSKRQEVNYDISGERILKNIYEISFSALIEKDGEQIDGFHHEELSDTVYNGNVWERAYDLVKERLRNNNYTFSDVLV